MRTTAVCMQYAMQTTCRILQQYYWLDPRCFGWGRRTAAFNLCLRSSIAHTQRLALHCTCVCSAGWEEACLKPVTLVRRHTKNVEKGGHGSGTANCSANFRSHLVPMYTSNPNPYCAVLVTRHSCHTTYPQQFTLSSRHVLRSGKLPLL
jgi:hypothetical protein